MASFVKDGNFNAVRALSTLGLPVVTLSLEFPNKGFLAYNVANDTLSYGNGSTWSQLASTGSTIPSLTANNITATTSFTSNGSATFNGALGTSTFNQNVSITGSHTLTVGTGLTTLGGGEQLGVAGTPAGYVPSTLNYYEAFSGNLSTDTLLYTFPITAAANFIRIGNMVNFTFAGITQTAANGTADPILLGVSPNVVPTRFVPAQSSVTFPITVVNGSTAQIGQIEWMGSNWRISLVPGINFTAGGAIDGVNAFSITYNV
jgi:hypothetical protein